MNEYTMEQINIGLECSFDKMITSEMEDMFRTISGDENPLHRDDEYAKSVLNGKYKKHISFGMLTAALYSTMAGMYLPGKYSLIHSIDNLSFVRPVYSGDILKVNGIVVEKNTELGFIVVKVDIHNQDNVLVSKAKMKILVTK